MKAAKTVSKSTSPPEAERSLRIVEGVGELGGQVEVAATPPRRRRAPRSAGRPAPRPALAARAGALGALAAARRRRRRRDRRRHRRVARDVGRGQTFGGVEREGGRDLVVGHLRGGRRRAAVEILVDRDVDEPPAPRSRFGAGVGALRRAAAGRRGRRRAGRRGRAPSAPARRPPDPSPPTGPRRAMRPARRGAPARAGGSARSRARA